MSKVRHQFVEIIPETLEERVVYVSFSYSTAVHSCCCGCGREVVTPLAPNDWKLIFDGETVSLFPSIGNWEFPCKSHYWIERNYVVWAKFKSKKRRKRGSLNGQDKPNRCAQGGSSDQNLDIGDKFSLWLRRLFSR